MLATLIDSSVERRKRLSWQNAEELLANIYELLSALRREQLIVAGVPAKDAPDFNPYPRPGQEVAVETKPKATKLRDLGARLMKRK